MRDPLEIASRHYYWKLSLAYFDAFQLRAYRDHVQLPEHGRILDLGCHDGIFGQMLSELLELNNPMTGVDVDGEALKTAARRTDVYAQTLQLDAAELGFESGSFDAIFANQILHALPDGPERAIDEAGRILKNGGQFIFTVTTDTAIKHFYLTELLGKLGLHRLRSSYQEKAVRRFLYHSTLPADTWQRLLEDRGFEVQAVVPFISREIFRRWSLYTLAPFRAMALLKLIPARYIEGLASAVVRRLISKSYRQLAGAVPADDADYVLIVARKAGNAAPQG